MTRAKMCADHCNKKMTEIETLQTQILKRVPERIEKECALVSVGFMKAKEADPACVRKICSEECEKLDTVLLSDTIL